MQHIPFNKNLNESKSKSYKEKIYHEMNLPDFMMIIVMGNKENKRNKEKQGQIA